MIKDHRPRIAVCVMIEIATNGVFEENRKAKHGRDAKNGWYRYDTRFALPVYGDDGNIERYNIFRGRLLIRHASSGKKFSALALSTMG